MSLRPSAPEFQSKLSHSFTIMIEEHSVPTDSYVLSIPTLGYEFPHTITQMPLPKHSRTITTPELGYHFPHAMQNMPLPVFQKTLPIKRIWTEMAATFPIYMKRY